MENPFSNPLHLPLSQGGLTVDHENPLVKRGNEGGFESRRADLPAPVRSFADRLHARITDIYKKYGASSVAELHAKIASGEKFRGLKPGELKSDSAEISKLVVKLQGLLERKGFAPGEEFEERKEALYETEKAMLSEFFERETEVPPLPEGITLERMKRWEALGLELHYLPPVDMAKEGDLKNWIKPDFKNIETSQLPKDAMLLPGCWVIVDGREKPEYGNGKDYDGDADFLGPVLERLRGKGLIEKSERPKSRFDVSPEELEKPEVAAAFAEAMGFEPGQVSLPRMVEFNVLGNIHHPEWGRPPSDAAEWFADKYQGGRRRLYGGDSASGGLACVYWHNPGSRHGSIGLRLLGRLS